MDILKHYSADHENNQRIVFAAIQANLIYLRKKQQTILFKMI
jgi:hypothetical protein